MMTEICLLNLLILMSKTMLKLVACRICGFNLYLLLWASPRKCHTLARSSCTFSWPSQFLKRSRAILRFSLASSGLPKMSKPSPRQACPLAMTRGSNSPSSFNLSLSFKEKTFFFNVIYALNASFTPTHMHFPCSRKATPDSIQSQFSTDVLAVHFLQSSRSNFSDINQQNCWLTRGCIGNFV